MVWEKYENPDSRVFQIRWSQDFAEDLISDQSLAAEAEGLDDLLVAGLVGIFKVIQEATAVGDEHEQTTAGGEIFAMGAEVLGQVSDTGAHERDLDIGGTGVFIVQFKSGEG